MEILTTQIWMWLRMDGLVLKVDFDNNLGGFNEGKMTGKGVLTLTNGEKFDGTFEDGTIEGVGAFHTLDG